MASELNKQSVMRHFVFTSFLPEVKWVAGRFNYLIYGKEKCPTTGRMHLQGYGEPSKPTKLGSIQTLMGDPGMRMDRRKGTQQQAADYCRKGEQTKEEWEALHTDGPNFGLNADVTEYGVMSKNATQGKRTDLDEVTDAISLGMGRQEVARQYPVQFVKFHSGIEKLCRVMAIKAVTPPYPLESFNCALTAVFDRTKAWIFYGKTSLGKTAYAIALLGPCLVVSHMDDLKSFDADIHTGGIVFDDMDFKHLPGSTQIHITDFDYDRAIHCRYDTATIPRGTLKIFTTNIPDGAIFGGAMCDDEQRLAIAGRTRKFHVQGSLFA